MGWHDPRHGLDCACEDCLPVARPEIAAWRERELLEAGYSLVDADLIANSRADLHEAVELVTVKGCPPATAAKIIL